MLIFNNGLESLDEASFVMGKFLRIEENDACFFFAGSVIFLLYLLHAIMKWLQNTEW